MSSLQYLMWWFCFLSLTKLIRFPVEFCVVKFSSFGWDIDMRRIRSGKTLSLGMPEAPQVNIQGRLKRLSLGMPRKASPLSSSKTISIPYSEQYFYSSHDMCFAWSVFLNFTCCWNKIIGYEILNNKSLDLKPWMRESRPMAI